VIAFYGHNICTGAQYRWTYAVVSRLPPGLPSRTYCARYSSERLETRNKLRHVLHKAPTTVTSGASDMGSSGSRRRAGVVGQWRGRCSSTVNQRRPRRLHH